MKGITAATLFIKCDGVHDKNDQSLKPLIYIVIGINGNSWSLSVKTRNSKWYNIKINMCDCLNLWNECFIMKIMERSNCCSYIFFFFFHTEMYLGWGKGASDKIDHPPLVSQCHMVKERTHQVPIVILCPSQYTKSSVTPDLNKKCSINL